MQKGHLHDRLLRAWEEGRLTGDELLEKVLPHLEADCESCRVALTRWRQRRGSPDLPAPSALAALRSRLRKARRLSPPTSTGDAVRRLDELMDLPPLERLRRIDQESWRHSSHLLILVTQERVREVRSRNVDEALELLEVAHKLVMLLDGSDDDNRATRAALAVTTYTLRSNLHRIRADLGQAEGWIRQARSLAFAIEPPDPFVMGELDLHEGALRIARRQLTRAVHLLASSACRFARSRSSLEQGQALILLADAFRLQQRHPSALDALAGALLVLHPTDDPLTFLSCQMQRALILCDVGDPRAAQTLIDENRYRLRELMHLPRVQFRLRALEGRIALAGGRHQEARSLLEEARALALERHHAYDAALVSLDLARVHLDAFDFDALRAEARAIIPVLTSEGLHQEAAAALSLYRDALLTGFVERRFLERLTRYLEAARRDPGLRFRAQGDPRVTG